VTSPGPAWWESAVIYQIYPRSFCDLSGDGVGDLEGIRHHLDHLEWLGVDAIWLSPFYRSPMADFGYDVSDFCDVDPLFGTLDDLDHLVADAHARDIKILVDWVPNHSSDAHPWFVAARSSRTDPKRDWYRWRDDRSDAEGGSGPPGSPGRLPNNWRSAFAGVGHHTLPPAWTFDEHTAQWYLHLFLPAQPDLNWENPELRAAMIGTLEFWMARGVDGFRVDVAHGLGKDPALPDLGPEWDGKAAADSFDDPRSHSILAELRRVLDGWPEAPARMMVGEVYLPTTRQVAPYYGTPERPELNLSFNFAPLFAPWDATEWRTHIDEVLDLLIGAGHWPTWVLSNHDKSRQRTRFGSEAKARAAAVTLLTLPGTPFLYAGEELGLEDAVIPADRRVDPGGRDGCRAPIPWTDEPSHGWAGGPQAWLPWPPDADRGRTAASLRQDRTSILWLYRHLLDARRGSPALVRGSFAWGSDTPSELAEAGILTWRRTCGADTRLVAVNYRSAPGSMPLPDGVWTPELTSDGAPAVISTSRTLTLGPDQAVVLRPDLG
jgi:alpha-glucosidase